MGTIRNKPGAAFETDSDRNEDEGREALLDDSYDAWYREFGHRAEERLELANVPDGNAFDAADEDDSPELVIDCDDQS